MAQQSSLICCAACRSAEISVEESRWLCRACGAAFPQIDGVIDFDLGRTVTQLDDLDYDEFYKIDSSSSIENVSQILADHGDIIPDRVDSLLEIGTGTGGFTVGMLRLLDVKRAVLSDVSTKMLAICQRRLEQQKLESKSTLQYVTYSGKDSCFSEESFDVCFGSAVLHHVMDVGSCLRDVHKALRPGGKAFFTEPNRIFHLAALHTLTDLIDREIRAGADPSDLKIASLAAWIAENRYNIIHTGDPEMLWFREDKHLFDRQIAERLREQSGFERVELRAVNPRDVGVDSLTFFLMQMGLTDERNAEVREKCKGLVPQYFELLQASDNSPSYLICFEKGTNDRGGSKEPVCLPKVRTGLQVDPRLTFEGYVSLVLGKGEMIIEGWFWCSETIRRLIIRAQGTELTIAVWKPRFDIYNKFLHANQVSIYDLMFSGIGQTCQFEGTLSRANISLEVMSGGRVDLGDHDFVDGRLVCHVGH
jgi:SAM-dependent methyltransferase